MSRPYENREIDEKFDHLKEYFREKHDEQMIKLGEIKVQTTTTNGKVKKIVVALVLVFGILIGQNFTVHDILGLFTHLI